MKICAIDKTNFTSKQTFVKATAAFGSAALGYAFVKGLSKPNADIEGDAFMRSNDDGPNPCDYICDELCDTPQDQREQDPCETCEEDCKDYD